MFTAAFLPRFRLAAKPGARLAAWCMLLLAPLLATALEISALTESLPPLNYEQDGKVVGFSSELLDLIAKEADITVHKQLLPWSRAYDMVGRQGNTLIYSLARTPEREGLFQWVGPISARRILLYRHSDRTDISIKTLDDARPYRIGVARESAAAKGLIKQGFVINGAQDVLGPGLDLGAHDESNMKKFIAKRFDLLVSLDWAAAYNAKNAGLGGDDLQAVWVLDESLSYWYGLNPATDPEVARRLNVALQKVKNDGRYLVLKQKYLPKGSR
jgi:polar amino acid transport system substrate-binding protein